jgi:methionyl-tRNA formyltransferase
MRVIFIATGDIALPAFRHLVENGPRPLALVTQPDKRAGRRQTIVFSGVKQVALAACIPIFQPEKIGDVADDLAALKPDVIVVMAYGQILRENILKLPERAIINLHASLLPKYRGASCIQAAIDAGDPETGITSMHVVRELDAGDMIVRKSLVLSPQETGGSLHDKLALLAVEVLEETLQLIESDNAPRCAQDAALSSYVSKLDRDDGRLDWNLAADVLERRIRAYDPWPGTFTTVEEDGVVRRLKIFPPVTPVGETLRTGALDLTDGRLLVGCGTGSLEISILQPEGGRRMAAAQYLCGKCPAEFV